VAAVCLIAFGVGAPDTRAAEIVASGIVRPFIDVKLSAAVPGIITSRKVNEGDSVKQGDVLLELDNSLERLEVERRKVVRDQKRDDFEGTRKLFGSTKGISKEELDKKEAEYLVALAEHEIAVEQLHRRQVLAPHTGVITDILIETGEACQPYEFLVQLVDTRQCYLLANIDAKDHARFKQAQEVMVEVDLGDGKVIVPGKVVFASPMVDPASGMQKVKVLFDNKDGKIRPGLTGGILAQNPV